MLKMGLYIIRLVFTGLFLSCLGILVPQSSTAQIFTDKNFVVIQPTGKEEDIIGKAAHVVPSKRQLRWQELELTGFIHFGVEYKDGGDWKMLIQGTTVGYKHLLKFPTVHTNAIRIKKESSRLNPTLAEVGLYKQHFN